MRGLEAATGHIWGDLCYIAGMPPHRAIVGTPWSGVLRGLLETNFESHGLNSLVGAELHHPARELTTTALPSAPLPNVALTLEKLENKCLQIYDRATWSFISTLALSVWSASQFAIGEQ